jgi:hypothetical protein
MKRTTKPNGKTLVPKSLENQVGLSDICSVAPEFSSRPQPFENDFEHLALRRIFGKGKSLVT